MDGLRSRDRRRNTDHSCERGGSDSLWSHQAFEDYFLPTPKKRERICTADHADPEERPANNPPNVSVSVALSGRVVCLLWPGMRIYALDMSKRAWASMRSPSVTGLSELREQPTFPMARWLQSASSTHGTPCETPDHIGTHRCTMRKIHKKSFFCVKAHILRCIVYILHGDGATAYAAPK